jgi:photosystem II stability/assembly factor-like uncharacterized protein
MSKVISCCLFSLALLFTDPVVSCAQSWQSVGDDSFEAISGTTDGTLLIVRYPGDILRSTDHGWTWHQVYHGNTRLTSIESSISEKHLETVRAYSDTLAALVSKDSGRSWLPAHERTSSHNQLPVAGPIAWESVAKTLIQSVVRIGANWYAVGEPGLIFVSDSSSKRWTELHRAPFIENDHLGETRETALIDFSSPAHGAIALADRIYFTDDSGTTWRALVMHDSNSISSFFLTSDTSGVFGMRDGTILSITHNTLHATETALRMKEITPPNFHQFASPPTILQFGWKDFQNGQLFGLTDSQFYLLSSDFRTITSNALPLRPGEHARCMSFADPYSAYLVVDSIGAVDSGLHEVRDSAVVKSAMYRSVDGGATWSIVLGRKDQISKLCFVNAKCGFACGARGLILRTEDSGMTWSSPSSMTKQYLRDIRFANDSTGYIAGDSGVVLRTQTGGKWWRLVPPDPLFMHPSTSYSALAFPDAHSVFVVARDRCYRQPITESPNYWSSDGSTKQTQELDRPTDGTFTISVNPNPTSGVTSFDVILHGATSNSASNPTLSICDLNGNSLYELSSAQRGSFGNWVSEVDLSSLRSGLYTVIATSGATRGLAKILVAH